MSSDVRQSTERLEKSSSFSKPSVASPTSQLILQPSRCFTYVTDHPPTLPSLHLRRRSFSNPSVALPRSQLILQLFRCLAYVTAYSPTFLSLFLRHRLFIYVIWRAAHVMWYFAVRTRDSQKVRIHSSIVLRNLNNI